MFPSVCTKCGKECEVPFQPTRDRPVYCQECWSRRRPVRTEDYQQSDHFREDRQRRSSQGLESVNLQILQELKRIREVLEKQASH